MHIYIYTYARIQEAVVLTVKIIIFIFLSDNTVIQLLLSPIKYYSLFWTFGPQGFYQAKTRLVLFFRRRSRRKNRTTEAWPDKNPMGQKSKIDIIFYSRTQAFRQVTDNRKRQPWHCDVCYRWRQERTFIDSYTSSLQHGSTKWLTLYSNKEHECQSCVIFQTTEKRGIMQQF